MLSMLRIKQVTKRSRSILLESLFNDASEMLRLRFVTCLMRNMLSMTFFLALSLPAYAQQTQVLRGRVFDADTHQPIPNAQVGIGGNRLGTSTNLEGRFALQVPAPYQGGEVEVALLGYRRYTQKLPPLPGSELRIELKSSPAGLGMVKVSASATGIIREAVARIPQNYSTRPTRLTGFLRESDDDASAHHYDYLAEGVLLVTKPPYQRPHEAGGIRILQSRKVDLRTAQANVPLPGINWMAGSFVPHRFDFVRARNEFIAEAHFKDYQYRVSPQTTFQGRAVYVITFEPKPGTDRANFAGQVYIDEQSYAFLGAEWHRTPAGIRREGVLSFEATERAYRTDYQYYAGRWHLKSIWYNTLGQPAQGHIRHHLAEYLTTAIDTAQAPPPTYLERAQYADIFLANPTPYDSTFWRHYTTSLPPTQLRLDLLDPARQHQADSLLASANRPAAAPSWGSRVLKSARYSYNVGLLPIVGPAASVRVVLAPGGSTFRADGHADTREPGAVLLYDIGLQLNLTPALAVYGQQQGLHFSQLKGEGWDVGLLLERNLNPHGRPLRGRVGVGYFRQTIARPLDTFDNPDESLRLAGTHLAADRLALSLQTVTDALHPQLGLSLELSHQFDAVAQVGYLVPLRIRSQLAVQEVESGFFTNESSTTLNLPATEAQVLVNGQPSTYSLWQPGRLLVSLSVLWRLSHR
ncbi:MAG: carboxypeptidase-like regulatory domain-containing protein [Janthinobacterium lividum]